MANELKPQIVNPQIQPQQIQPGPKLTIPGVCAPGQDHEVMLTVLPNGSEPGKLRFSVLISPRLKPACDTTLANFPMFLDWPATVRNFAFQLFVDGMGNPVPAQPLYNPASLDSNLWKAIFQPNTFVRQFKFDQGEHTKPSKYFILPLRERNFHRFQIKQDLYQNLALQSPAKLPAKDMMLQRLEGAGIVQKQMLKPGVFQYKMMGTQFQNPVAGIMNLRDQMIQQELRQFQGLPGGQLPGGQLPGGGIMPGVQTIPGGPQMQPGGQMQPGMQMGPGGVQGGPGMIFQRGVGGKPSDRKVPYNKDPASVQTATGMTPKQFEFTEFRAFAYKPDKPFVKSKLPGVNEWKNIIDFHQVVASLADYPEIMRRLGLVLDFVVPDAGFAPNGAIAVRTAGIPPQNLISPKTRYDKSKGFRALVGWNPELQEGLLKFGLKDSLYNLPLYDVVPGDVEGAIAKISNFTKTLLEPSAPDEAEEAQSLPALRSGGLGVAHAERDIWLDKLMDASNALNEAVKVAPPPNQPKGSNILLTAENLIRGFRIDVRSRPAPSAVTPAGPWGPWRSLCERQGLYYLGANLPPVVQHRDEGWVSLGVTVGEPAAASQTQLQQRGVEEGGVQERGTPQMGPMGGAAQQALPLQLQLVAMIKPLLIYESLFRWVGWGLSVDRPYKSLPDPSLGTDCAPVPDPALGNVVACSPVPGLNLMAAFVSVPGTLPKLRFGRQYQFRARIVDLAGNSRLLTDLVDPAQEPLVVTSDLDGYYDRFEPVPSPTVVLTRNLTGLAIPPQGAFRGFPQGEPLSPCESVNYLIIRSANIDPLTDPALAPLLDANVGPKGGPENPFSDRHIVPPRISEELAEAHGMFDNPQTHAVGGPIAGKDAYDQIVTHDATLTEAYGAPGAPEFFVDPAQKPFITVPYLPDPMSAGATFVIYAPGTDPDNGLVVKQPFAGNWPDMMSFRLLMKGGVGNPQFNNGVLEVQVPIGEERLIKLSSHFPPGKEWLFGIWRWIVEKNLPPPQLNALLQMALQGRHWMLTPSQELRLVHAVQQPVLTPHWLCHQVLPQSAFGEAGAPACADNSPGAQAARQRRLGQTTATIEATMVIHRPSTMSLDLYARWREPNDRGVMRSDQEDPQRNWLYLEGKASPFSTTISYAPEPVRVATLAPGALPLGAIQQQPPVFKRGIPGESPVEGEADAVPEEHRTRILQDAQELPIESPVQPRGVPEEGSQAPAAGEGAASGKVQERGAAPLAQFQQKPPIGVQQLQQAPPVVVAPKPQGPPPFDETPYRCAPGQPPPPPPPPQGIPAVQYRFQGLHRFGDTKYRCVGYKVVATSRYRQIFRPLSIEPLPQPRFNRESPWAKMDVLNTAPPDPPKVLYIIPTFKWETTPQGRRRTGGGLRVYLDRPWFSSGDGERLAVVLYPDPRAPVIPDEAVPYVSQWGLDPLWEKGPQTGVPALGQIDPNLTIPQIQPQMPPVQMQPQMPSVQPRGLEQQGMMQAQKLPYGKIAAAIAPPPVGGGHPAPEHFRNEDHVRYDLGISEVQLPLTTVGTRDVNPQMMAVQMQPLMLAQLATRPMPVTICAFNVFPDPSRQLWYCDIDMDPGLEYYPFVRLALARYQVNSVRGAHLSKVVMADFVQLVPERAISAVPDPKNPGALLVSVSGVIGYAAHFRKTVLEAIVEEANPNVQGELSWSPVPNSTVDSKQWQFAGPNQRTASVPLPTAGSGKVFRLIVKEYEEFVDTEADESGKVTTRGERRLVYADVVPVQGQLGLKMP